MALAALQILDNYGRLEPGAQITLRQSYIDGLSLKSDLQLVIDDSFVRGLNCPLCTLDASGSVLLYPTVREIAKLSDSYLGDEDPGNPSTVIASEARTGYNFKTSLIGAEVLRSIVQDSAATPVDVSPRIGPLARIFDETPHGSNFLGVSGSRSSETDAASPYRYISYYSEDAPVELSRFPVEDLRTSTAAKAACSEFNDLVANNQFIDRLRASTSDR